MLICLGLRASSPRYVWGEFDVDCQTNTVLGERANLVAQLTRAYVRAAPGRLVRIEYVDATGALTAETLDAPAGAETLIFYPSARHGAPAVEVEGLGDLRTVDAPGGNTYVMARTKGGSWSVHI